MASMTSSSRPPSPSVSSTSLLNPTSLQPSTIKTIDLNSYFLDIHGEKDHDLIHVISKLKATLTSSSSVTNYIQLNQISISNETKKNKYESKWKPEEEVEQDNQEEEWVPSEWKALIGKQKVEEHDIRKLILSRKILQPIELKEWLDSALTYDLPDLSLGVLLRLDPLAAISVHSPTIPNS